MPPKVHDSESIIIFAFLIPSSLGVFQSLSYTATTLVTHSSAIFNNSLEIQPKRILFGKLVSSVENPAERAKFCAESKLRFSRTQKLGT